MTPDEAPLTLTAGPEHDGQRLDRVLAVPAGSRSRAQALIDAGAVTVDGSVVAKRHAVRAGESIVVRPPTADEPGAGDPEPVPFTIAWQDPYLLVVDKPAGVVVHPARGHRSGTLAQALTGLAAGGEDGSRAGIVHRLDRETSGLLVVARSEAVHRALKDQLSSRTLHREYLALVDGIPETRTGTIEAPIGRDRRDRLRMSIDTDEPRDARTHFTLERRVGDGALLRVVLDTGRTHQIRVHLSAIGLPVAGDPAYGTPGAHGLTRQFLHAARLSFTHPITRESLDVTSPLPADLAAVLDGLSAGEPAG